jgi:hypothetical protein
MFKRPVSLHAVIENTVCNFLDRSVLDTALAELHKLVTLVITSGISIIEWMIRGVLLHLSGSHPQRERCPRGSGGPCHVDILQKPWNNPHYEEAAVTCCEWQHAY